MTILLSSGTPYTFGDLQTEFYARGFDYLDQDAAGRTRAKRWLNQAYQELCEAQPWPFLETTVTGPAPMGLDGIRAVRAVVRSDNTRLWQADKRGLLRSWQDLTQAGTPDCFYFSDDGELAVFPASDDELTVHCLAIPDELEDDTDPLVIPARYVDILIDGAAIKGLKDSDNWETVRIAREEYERQLAGMTRTLLTRNQADPETVVRAELW